MPQQNQHHIQTPSAFQQSNINPVNTNNPSSNQQQPSSQSPHSNVTPTNSANPVVVAANGNGIGKMQLQVNANDFMKSLQEKQQQITTEINQLSDRIDISSSQISNFQPMNYNNQQSGSSQAFQVFQPPQNGYCEFDFLFQ